MESKKSKNLILIIVLLVILVGALVAIFFIGNWYYSKRFLPHTTINGVDASDKTADEVRFALQDKIREYTLTLEERGGSTEKITGDQLYMQYADDGSIDRLLAEQNKKLWLIELAKDKNLSVSTGFTYDETTVDSIMDGLNCFQKSNIVEPQDAHIDESGDTFTVVDAEAGTKLKRDETKTAIENAIKNGEELHFTAGDQTRQYICVDEVPRLLEMAFDKRLPSGMYNIQGKETLTVKEIVEMIHHEMGKEVPEGCFGTAQRSDVGMKYLALNGQNLYNTIGFEATIKLSSIIGLY